VVTTGALERLDHHQLAAALAHERAHLSQRHHLVLAWAGGLAHAFPRVGLFGQAQTESQRLVELLADDVAARSVDRLTLAEALLALAGTTPRLPVPAMGAGGSTAATRVRRLIEPPRRLGRLRALLTALAAALVLAVPIVALASPAIAATHMNYCPTQSVAASSAPR
jgi:beta-lactamase regulating signal transducer with metallopeptidase domain